MAIGSFSEEQYLRALSCMNAERMIDLLRKMLRLPSFSRSKEESELALFLRDHLKSIGLEVQLQEVEKDRFNVLGTIQGTGGGKRLLLNGHMDVNPPAEGWTKDPYAGTIEEGWIFGIGAVNMKGGDAALIAAVDAIKKAGIELRGDVVLALVVGELQGGIGTVRMLEQGMRADAFILAEPTELMAIIKHTGMVHVTITVVGRSCHLSSAENGLSAIEAMINFIHGVEKAPTHGAKKLFERMNLGSIKGGLTHEYHTWRPSLVPDYCTATCDFRIPPGQTEGSLLKGLKEMARDFMEKRGAQIQIEPVPPPLYYHMPPFGVSEQEEIVQLVLENHRMVTGENARIADFPPYFFYADDASHLNGKGRIPGVVYGPGGANVSRPDESIRVEDIITASKVYLRSILRFCA